MRKYWEPYLQNVNVLIYVIDSTSEKLADCKQDLQKLVGNAALKDSSLIILSNKADRDGQRLSVKEVGEGLGLENIGERKWRIFETAGLTGQGLSEVKQQIREWLPGIDLDA